jgi:hypothetical protein
MIQYSNWIIKIISCFYLLEIQTPWLIKPRGSYGLSNNLYPEPNQPNYSLLDNVTILNTVVNMVFRLVEMK